MWISTKYPIKHNENSSIYELMQLISNSPIISTEILFSPSHSFLDLFFLLTSYPTKNCVFAEVLSCFTSQEVLLLCQTQPLNTEAQVKWQSGTLCLRHEELKNSQSNHWPNSHPAPWQAAVVTTLCISNQSLNLYRGNLQHTFRCTFPKAPWPVTQLLSAPSSLEGLPCQDYTLFDKLQWRQTDI